MITLKKIAQSIEPTWDLQAWFNWPPDIFALISIVVQRTGSYKIALVNDAYWQDGHYKESVKHDAEKWASMVSANIVGGKEQEREHLDFSSPNIDDGEEQTAEQFKLLSIQFDLLKKDWDQKKPLNTIDLNKLRSFDLYNPKSNDKPLQRYASALAQILAIADASCAGMGMISNCLDGYDTKNLAFKLYANVLLNSTGSLSTILKFHGAVFPKMRTPQSGIVLRSMSHHLSFHQTEVEVVWRTFPWAESKRQSLNVMVVPVPFEIYKTDFEIVEQHHSHSKYFKVKPKADINEALMDGIVAEVCRKATTNNDVDILVFPEMSLSKPQYDYLLEALRQNRKEIARFRPSEHNGLESCRKLPLIIAGVLSDDSIGNEIHPMDNQIRMAIYFHGSWYDISQLKHHRWQLDRSQITQYGLEGHLSTEYKWTEYCSILQRRLTVLCPNDWFSITALICEDLARQEPVGEVIRGIGPTILAALLSDGPQIKERWSARYASVLADDPGTSVLSITSKGMAERSRRADGSTDKDKEVTIGLWKDLVKSWDLLKLEKGHNALMFTISSKFVEEHTLDGRNDSAAASVFKMDSIAPKQIKLNDGRKLEESIPAQANLCAEAFVSKMDSIASNQTESEDKTESNVAIPGQTIPSTVKSWLDLRTLSTWTFIVDTLVDMYCIDNSQKDEIKWIESLFGEKARPSSRKIQSSPKIQNVVQNKIISAWKNPNLNGTSISESIESAGVQSESDKNKAILHALKKFLKEITQRNDWGTKMFLEIVISHAKKVIKNNKNEPELKLLLAIFLHNLNGKLSEIIKKESDAKPLNSLYNPSRQTADFSLKIKEILLQFDDQLER